MTETQKTEILLTILAYTKGNWTPDDCYEYYYFWLNECQTQKVDLKVVKKDGCADTH